MDLANAVATDRIKAGEYQIPRLTMRELADLTQTIRDERREALLRSLDDAGLDGFDKLAELQKHDHSPVGVLDGAVWCRTAIGCMKTIEAALAKDPALPQSIDDLGIYGQEAVVIGYELWGFLVDRTPDPDANTAEGETEDDDPFPIPNPTTQTG